LAMAWRRVLGITQLTRSSVLTGMDSWVGVPEAYQGCSGYMTIREVSSPATSLGTSPVHDVFIGSKGGSDNRPSTPRPL
jgi:hypothetical protein